MQNLESQSAMAREIVGSDDILPETVPSQRNLLNRMYSSRSKRGTFRTVDRSVFRSLRHPDGQSQRILSNRETIHSEHTDPGTKFAKKLIPADSSQ